MKLFSISFDVRAWLSVAAVLTLLSCGGGDSGSSSTPDFTVPTNNVPSTTQAGLQQLTDAFAATLAGAQEVPPVQSTGLGAGTVVVDPVTRIMIATLTTSGIPGTAAHIQQGATGVSGPIIFPLSETLPGSGIWTAKTTLTDAELSTLRAGNYYFNVRSTAFPDGEIRGQITSQSNVGTTGSGTGADTVITPLTAFLSALRGSQVVPPTPSTALGAGSVVTTPSTRELTATIVTFGVIGTAANIQDGALGVNGPIIVPLTETTPGSGIWTARTTLTPEQSNRLNAGNLYFNVHSAAFPNGEIRGQIVVQRQTLANSIGPGPTTTTGFTNNGGTLSPFTPTDTGTSITGMDMGTPGTNPISIFPPNSTMTGINTITGTGLPISTGGGFILVTFS